MKRAITSTEAPRPMGAYSPAIVCDGWVFVSGQAGFKPDLSDFEADNVELQTQQALANIQQLLAAAGSSLAAVVQTTCYLADVKTFRRFDAAYASFFADAGVEALPARTTIGATIPIAVEIAATARVTR